MYVTIFKTGKLIQKKQVQDGCPLQLWTFDSFQNYILYQNSMKFKQTDKYFFKIHLKKNYKDILKFHFSLNKCKSVEFADSMGLEA